MNPADQEAAASRSPRAARLFGLVALVLALVAAAGCASSAPPAQPQQPYKVVLLPVEGGAQAISAPRREGAEGKAVAFALTPEELERIVYEGVRKSNVFSEIVVAPPEVRVARGEYAGDELAAAAAYARKVGADLILRMTIRSAQIQDLGTNSSAAWSTGLWFLVPAPVWTVDDRTYEVDLAIEAALYDPRNVVRPVDTQRAGSLRLQDLDLWDRGLSWWVPIIPPPFLPGSDRKVSETLTRRAVEQAMAQLAEKLRTTTIPYSFEVAIAPSGSSVAITVTTPRQLRTLEIFADGKLVKSWSETDLVPAEGSTPERHTYRRTVDVAGAAEVRVVAEDEAGAREVRTVRMGAGR